MTDEPLIYTKNGNMRENDLQMTVEWFITSDYIKVVKKHFDKETGEMVKEGADVLSLHGVTGESILGKLNG